MYFREDSTECSDYLRESTELQMTSSHMERLGFNMMVLTLLETARMKNLSLNPEIIQFKSADCKFFGHRLTPEGLKPDPEKVKAIADMKPLQSIQSLHCFNGLVNYLKRLSPFLTKLSEPLRRQQKWDSLCMGI